MTDSIGGKIEKDKTAGKCDPGRIPLLLIFAIMFRISAFTFGGGYVIISMMQKEFVEKRGWSTTDEMKDILVVAQSAPGPIAVNSAIMMGYKLRGTAGIAAAVIGMSCPPLIILTLISMFYTQFRSAKVISSILLGMRAGVAAIVLDVAVTMCTEVVKGRQALQISIMVAAFLAVAVFGISAITVIVICLITGLIRTALRMRM